MNVSPSATTATQGNTRIIAAVVIALFFFFGFATVLVDTLIPKFKALFSLNYTEAMLTQFCYFFAYFVISVPAGYMLSRIGYMRGIVVGLGVMVTGCLLFFPAAYYGTYPGFLVALFTLASGVTTIQVAANPLMTQLGDPAQASSRLTLAQAFNSLGTTIGPLIGSALILSKMSAVPDAATLSAAALALQRKTDAQAVQSLFFGLAALLFVLALVVWFLRNRTGEGQRHTATGFIESLGLLRCPQLALGALSIFVYVGAEVSIGSLMVSYLTLDHTLHLTPAVAGRYVALYWGGAMVGRFIGAAVLRKVAPGTVLCACALMAALLAASSALSAGVVAAYCVLAVGLFNSIQFPTTFSIAIEGAGEDTPQASGLMCMAIVGGALVPLLTGAVADRFGLPMALFVPVVCYLWIAAYGLLARRGTLGEPATVV